MPFADVIVDLVLKEIATNWPAFPLVPPGPIHHDAAQATLESHSGKKVTIRNDDTHIILEKSFRGMPTGRVSRHSLAKLDVPALVADILSNL